MTQICLIVNLWLSNRKDYEFINLLYILNEIDGYLLEDGVQIFLFCFRGGSIFLETIITKMIISITFN